MSKSGASLAQAIPILARPAQEHTLEEVERIQRYMARHPEQFPSIPSTPVYPPASPSLSEMSRQGHLNRGFLDLSTLSPDQALAIHSLMANTEEQWNNGQNRGDGHRTPRPTGPSWRQGYDEPGSPSTRHIPHESRRDKYNAPSRIGVSTPSPPQTGSHTYDPLSAYRPVPLSPVIPRSAPTSCGVDAQMHRELSEYKRSLNAALEADVALRELYWKKVAEEQRRH